MERFERVSGIAVPLLRADIDTDQIIPVREMVRAYTEGYGPSLFAYWRYTGDRVPNPDFILNQSPWCDAVILLAERNFGCGSSRESAPKALREYGFRCIIAPSFSGVFYNNCFRNGLLPIELPSETVQRIATQVQASAGRAQVAVDLEAETVTAPDGERMAFRTPALLRRMLLSGMDETDLVLSMRETVEAFRTQDRERRPWAYEPAGAE